MKLGFFQNFVFRVHRHSLTKKVKFDAIVLPGTCILEVQRKEICADVMSLSLVNRCKIIYAN